MAKRSLSQKSESAGTPMRIDGRVVGRLVGNELRKNLKTSGMLTTPPALANDIQLLHDAERLGAEFCVLKNTEAGITYRASISEIWDLGVRFNRGYGDQIYLVLNRWKQTRDGTTHTAKPEYSKPTATDDEDVKVLEYKSYAPVGVKFTPGAKQLDLFGGR